MPFKHFSNEVASGRAVNWPRRKEAPVFGRLTAHLPATREEGASGYKWDPMPFATADKRYYPLRSRVIWRMVNLKYCAAWPLGRGRLEIMKNSRIGRMIIHAKTA
jgi:hypothetical protein